MGQVHKFPLVRAFLAPKIRLVGSGLRRQCEVIPFPGPRYIRKLDKQTLRFVKVQRDVLEVKE